LRRKYYAIEAMQEVHQKNPACCKYATRQLVRFHFLNRNDDAL